MSRLNDDYDVPDPVGAALDRLRQWADLNPVKAEGGAIGVLMGGSWLAFPGHMWGLATAYPFRFGAAMCLGALAWCVRYEVRERRLQRWLLRPGAGFRWVVDSLRWVGDVFEVIGHWEWTDGRRKPATVLLREREEAAASAAADEEARA